MTLGNLPAPLIFRCVVTDATDYDILVGQQALYPLGFGLYNWTEEAWIRPGWSAGDGRKEIIHVAFAATAIIEPLSMVFGCSAIVDTFSFGSALLEESFAFMRDVGDTREMAPRHALVRHPKDPLHPWHDSKDMRTLSSLLVLPYLSFRMVHPRWHAPFCGALQTLELL